MIFKETNHFLERIESRKIDKEMLLSALLGSPLMTRPGDTDDSVVWRVRLSNGDICDVALIFDLSDSSRCTIKSAWKVGS